MTNLSGCAILTNRKERHLESWDEEDAFLVPATEKDLSVEDEIDLYGARDLLSPEERTHIIRRFFEGCSSLTWMASPVLRSSATMQQQT